MFSSNYKVKTGKSKKLLSRKQRRKQERAVKKQRKASHFLKQSEEPHQPSIPSTVSPQPSEGQPPRTTSQSKRPPLKQPDLTKLHRKRALEISNQREDAEISRLEKLLKIKRRKKLPTSFKDEGLDCIQQCIIQLRSSASAHTV